MRYLLIIFLIFSFFVVPVAQAQEINLNQIDFENLNLDKLPDFSFESSGEGLSSGEALSFFKNLYKLGKQVKSLVVTVWGVASTFLEEVTGFSLGQILTELINVTIGIVGVMIELITKVVG